MDIFLDCFVAVLELMMIDVRSSSAVSQEGGLGGHRWRQKFKKAGKTADFDAFSGSSIRNGILSL